MKKSVNQFVPSALKRINDNNLLNNRLLWATNLPYVAFFAVLFWLVCASFVNLQPISTAYIPNAATLFACSLILVLIPLGFWVYRQSGFQMLRNGTLGRPLSEHSIFFMYLLCATAFFVTPYWVGFETERQTADLATYPEMHSDCQKMNLGYGFIGQRSYYNHSSNVNSAEARTDWKEAEYLGGEEMNIPNLTVFSTYSNSSYKSAPYSGTEDKGYEQMSNAFRGLKTIEQKVEALRTYLQVAKKYGADYSHLANRFQYHIDQIYSTQPSAWQQKVLAYNQGSKSLSDSELGINPAMFLVFLKSEHSNSLSYDWDAPPQQIHQNLSAINSAREYPFFVKNEALTTYSLGIFFTAILLWIFQNVGIWHFLRGVFGLFLGGGFVALLGSFCVGVLNTHEDFVLVIIGSVYGLALLLGVSARTAARFSHLKSIALIVATLMTPLMFVWGHELFNSYTNQSDFNAMAWLGMITFVLLALPLFKKSYLKLYSLPKGA